MSRQSGLFLVLEGIDGSGKDTQIEMLRLWLPDQATAWGGLEPCFSKEPGAGLPPLRRLLLEMDMPLVPLAETLLFIADRAQHMEQLVRPLLEAGKPVVLNRHTASTLAYQGYGKGIDRTLIAQLNRQATGGVEPDRIYLLDVPVEAAMARFHGRGRADRMEMTGHQFLGLVRAGFLEMAGQQADRWLVLDGTRDPDDIQALIRKDILALLAREQGSAGGKP